MELLELLYALAPLAFCAAVATTQPLLFNCTGRTAKPHCSDKYVCKATHASVNINQQAVNGIDNDNECAVYVRYDQREHLLIGNYNYNS